MGLRSGDELREAADAGGKTQSPGKPNEGSFRDARVEFLESLWSG